MKISLIISDIDGTLLPAGCDAYGRSRDGKDVSAAVRELGALIRTHELPFTLASGRPIGMIAPLASVLSVRLPVIAANGAEAALLSDGNGNRGVTAPVRFLWSETLCTAALRPAIELADRLGMAVIWTDGTTEKVYRKNAYTLSHELSNRTWAEEKRPVSEAEWENWKLQKLLIIDPETPGRVDEVIRAVGEAPESNAEVVRYDDRGVEIMPAGCTKGSGIKRLARELSVPLSEILVFGDNKNDIQMFREAGFGAAVGNAVPALKEEADYICRNEAVTGVVEAIRKFVIA